MATSTLPLFFTLFGFYGFVDLAAWDAHGSPTVIAASNLYGVASLAIVMLSSVGVEYLFGTRHPAKELESEMQSRLSIPWPGSGQCLECARTSDSTVLRRHTHA